MNFLMNSLDLCILYEKNNHTSFFNGNTHSYGTRFFFLTKLLVNSIIPNEGKILGYPLSDNLMKLVYNVYFRANDESPFFINGSLFTFHANYFYQNLKLITNKFFFTEIASSSPEAEEPNILYNFECLTNVNDETWDNFLEDEDFIRMRTSSRYHYNCFYNHGGNTVTGSSFDMDLCFFNYRFNDFLSLIGFELLAVNTYRLKSVVYKLDEIYALKLINLRDYFFTHSNINLLIDVFNDLEKNQINFKLILNFIDVLYEHERFSYIHLYMNIYNFNNIKEESPLQVENMLNYLKTLVEYRLKICRHQIKEESPLFLDSVDSITLSPKDDIIHAAKVVSFLEELKSYPDDNIENSSLMKEYFLLQMLKASVKNFENVED